MEPAAERSRGCVCVGGRLGIWELWEVHPNEVEFPVLLVRLEVRTGVANASRLSSQLPAYPVLKYGDFEDPFGRVSLSASIHYDIDGDSVGVFRVEQSTRNGIRLFFRTGTSVRKKAASFIVYTESCHFSVVCSPPRLAA